MSSKRFSLVCLPIILGGLFLALLFASASSAHYGSIDSDLPLSIIDQLSSRVDGISFRLNVPEVTTSLDGRVVVAGLEHRFGNPGEPDLPYFSKLVLLPPGADAYVSIVPASAESVGVESVNLNPENSEAIVVGRPDLVQENGTERLIVAQESQKTLPDIFPAGLFSLTKPMYLRELRLVRLDIFPIRYLSLNGKLSRIPQMEVEVRFVGSDPGETHRSLSMVKTQSSLITDSLLNPEMIGEWGSLPVDMAVQGPGLPIGKEVFKILVEEDGIYELSYGDLMSSGMDVNNIDPTTFEMMFRGKTVAFEFIGDATDGFDPGESLRFYGWSFDGSRLEKQYVNENVFWLWAGGTSTGIPVIQSVAGVPVTSFKESITKEPENIWFAGWTDDWAQFPNEPDAWYWAELNNTSVTPVVTANLQLEILHPVLSGPDAEIVAEFTSRNDYSFPITHEVSILINDQPMVTSYTWFDIRNVNISNTLPLTQLNDGANALDVVLESESTSGAVYLNRVTADYLRQLRAVNDEILFTSEESGPLEFQVTGFQNSDQLKAIIWNISDRLEPIAINSATISITGSAGSFTYTFGSDYSTPSQYIATTTDNVRKPVAISKYIPRQLDSDGQGADWVAISHSDFLTEVARLASHRSEPEYGGLSTLIVDIDDVVNQYGFGLPLPEAIENFLGDAISGWFITPRYVTLFGDATLNPHNNLNRGSEWSDPQYLLTNLEFVDRYQGQIPSDLKFSTLVGDDLLPDIAMGRIPVQNADEAASVVSKIINYEENRLVPEDWMLNMLFLADATDVAGNFCLENLMTAMSFFPSQFEQSHYCLGQPPYTEAATIRAAFLDKINNEGATLVNYRGHGSVTSWSGIIRTSDIDCSISEPCWENSRPAVIVTGDCLDAYFTVPNRESLGESLLQATDKGSAAHFSSTGLGFSSEHSKMIEAFYEGLFVQGHTAIGDAANYARIQYANWSSGHVSILYSFLLQGDPAMQLLQPSANLTLSASKNDSRHEDQVEYHIGISNYGLYPGLVSVENTLPPGLQLIGATSSITAELETVGQTTRFDLSFSDTERDKGMPWNATATITVSAVVSVGASPGIYFDEALVTVSGLDSNASDNSQSVILRIWSDNPVLLPFITKQH